MPVDQAPVRPAARPNDGAKLVKYHDYIDQKIESTRRLVKVVDLATSLVALAIGVLLFLLAVVVLEHWVVRGGLSGAARWVLFGGLAAYVAYFAYRRLWPLCVHAINPVYAAHTIEHNSPALKNSLINLLMFRERRSDISDAVYRTLEEQAAQGLTRVQVDASVDQSQLIRLGYVLIAVVAVAGLYKVFSPKDPLVAAERVLMPWADVVPASRVSINDIKPGAATVSRGEHVDVSAEIRGLVEGDDVIVRFTTGDGQVVGRGVPMRLGRDGLRYTARVTDEADSSTAAGLTRSITYWLEAGDARSLNYEITVVPAASILVERVDYDYPAYTGYLDRSVEGIGDIRAIEGTRVTVHARANGVIREASVDFNADGRRDLTMTATDRSAHGAFELALREDRQTPRHASYVLRFTNDEGRANIDPVKHAIVVERDLDPEAAIRVPEEKLRNVRVDEKVAIEVDARDPDFALAAVRLRGEAAGREVIVEPLLKSEHRGKFTGRYVLTPGAHGLKPGDVLEYWVEADDNRAPKPNAVATERKYLKIVASEPAAEQQKKAPNQQRQGENQQPQQGEKGGQQGEGQGQGQGEGRQQSNSQGGEGQQGQGGEGQKDQGGGQGQGEGQGVGSEQKQGAGETGRGGESKQSQGGESGRDEKGQQKSDNEQTGAGASGGESSRDGTQPAGAQADQERGEQSNQDKSPVSSEGDNDAEAFERIQKRLEESGELKPEEAGEGGQEKGGESSEQQRHGEGETGRGGESKDGASDAANAKSGEKPQGQEQQRPGENSKDQADGGGAETRGDNTGDNREPKNGEGQEEKAPGGEQTASKGGAGKGDEQKSQGSPNSKEGMKPKEKAEQKPSEGEKTNQQEPPAGANSKKESDSHGDEGGDKAGGGEEGGGQKAPREGTGSDGANQSADNGAGQSGEKGKGENSKEGGQDARSEKPTGESDGKTQGKGSEREGQGEKQGGKQGEGQTGSGGEQQAREQSKSGDQGKQEAGKQGDQNEKQNDAGAKKDDSAGGASQGGGEPGGGVNQQPSITGEAPDGDEANLEYARKQTDLVLEKLSEQLKQKKVDDGLLKDLGWSEADLKKFVERWKQRKAAAAQNDEAGDAAKRELDDALRSLGLKRGELRQNAAQKDTLRDLREGFRGPVPPEYKERLKAYNQGVSQAKGDE